MSVVAKHQIFAERLRLHGSNLIKAQHDCILNRQCLGFSIHSWFVVWSLGFIQGKSNGFSQAGTSRDGGKNAISESLL